MTSRRTKIRTTSVREKDAALQRAVGALLERLETRTCLAAVGPEGYGYIADATPYEEIDLVPGGSGVVTVLQNAWGDAASIDLGANTFRYYGTTYTGDNQLFVNHSGLITFGNSTWDSGYNGDLTSYPAERAIAPLWDYWSESTVLARIQDTGGTSAADRLVIEWTAYHGDAWSDPRSPVTFQAILQLNTGLAPGRVTFNYVDLDAGPDNLSDGTSATVGIKDTGLQGSNRLLISHDNPNNTLLGDHKAILLTSTGGVDETDGVLTVTGTDSDDSIILTVSGTQLSVDRNGDVNSFALADLDRIEIRSRDGNDTVNCSPVSLPISIDTGAGDDHITAGSGRDNLFGGDGNDWMASGDGDDIIRGWNGDDVIDSGAGNDTVLGGDAADKIVGGDGDDLLSGGSQKDTIDGGLGSDRLNGNGGHDRLYGGPGADRLYGYDHNDSLDGGSSNDRLEGGLGTDTLVGQGGDDRFFAVDPGEVDQVFGGTGNDTGTVDAADLLESVEAKVVSQPQS